jgi:glycosyltransferase involved in cell wall biosynthesis
MVHPIPRVACFPDSFHEVNGVAHTSRQFEAFARRRNLPFLCVRAGNREERLQIEGSAWTLELPRSILSFALEKDLRFDPTFFRHIGLVHETLRRFQPDLVHITGPSDVGILGAWLAHQMDLPLAASWHTNVHEYAARRAAWLLHFFTRRGSAAAARKIENVTMEAIAILYRRARVLFAPNPKLCEELELKIGRSCRLMPRGVDALLFSPAKRRRDGSDTEPVLGYVGRLSVEKNVALLARIQQDLDCDRIKFRFRIVGHGAEEPWLRERLPRAEFTGVLHGEALAEAYAGMDLLVFPSHTDTFGNVVLEALASGVPAAVTPDGGPASIVRDGQTGRVVPDEGFAPAIAELLSEPVRLAAMRQAARNYAESASWDSVFEGVYAAYPEIVSKFANRAAVEPKMEPSARTVK